MTKHITYIVDKNVHIRRDTYSIYLHNPVQYKYIYLCMCVYERIYKTVPKAWPKSPSHPHICLYLFRECKLTSVVTLSSSFLDNRTAFFGTERRCYMRKFSLRICSLCCGWRVNSTGESATKWTNIYCNTKCVLDLFKSIYNNNNANWNVIKVYKNVFIILYFLFNLQIFS